MSFLAPLFLLGGLAIAAPVVFHLIRRTTRERTVFSSLMFLKSTPPRLTRRNRIEHWLLLLLRCAVLGLLAVGFARPFFKQDVPLDPTAAPARRIALLVDTSASMRQAGLWSAARQKADAILAAITPRDQVALFAFNRQLTTLVSFEQWNATPDGDRAALARSRLAALQPTWSGTHLASALLRAVDRLNDVESPDPTATRQVILISDFQEGSRLDELQNYDWPAGVDMVVERVAATSPNNAGLQLAGLAASARQTADNAGVRVRVNNAAASQRDQFQLGWAATNGNDFVVPPLDVYVPAGQSRVVAVPVAATNLKSDRIVLRGDDEPFDNTVFVMPPEPARLHVLYLGDERPSDMRQPLFFLQRAFQKTRRRVVTVTVARPDRPPPPAALRAASLLIVSGALNAASIPALRQFVSDGKTLLVLLRAKTAAGPGLARLLAQPALDIAEAEVDNYAMLGEIDFGHPLFAPFADARFSDFTKIHFWKYRRWHPADLPGARVPARFDNGDPAMVEIPLGSGRVMVLNSSWQPADSQLALSSKFVPLLYSLLELGTRSDSAAANYSVADPVPLPPKAAAAGQTVRVVRPDQTSVSLDPAATRFSATTVPGQYRFEFGSVTQRFAINLPAGESRTTPLPLDELEQWGAAGPRAVPNAARVMAKKKRLRNAELESRQKLWRWFIIATLTVLLLETWLGGWTARRQMMPTPSIS